MAAKDDKKKEAAPQPEAVVLRRDDGAVEAGYRRADRLLFHLADGHPLEVPINAPFVPHDADQAQVLKELELPAGFAWEGAETRALGPGATWGSGDLRVWHPNNPAGVLASPNTTGALGGAAATGATTTAPGAPPPAASTGTPGTTTTSSAGTTTSGTTGTTTSGSTT